MAEDERPHYTEDNDNRRWPLWWIVFPVLLVLSLLATGYLYYKYYNSTHAADGKSYESLYKDVGVKYATEKADLNRQLDELTARLQATIQDKDAEIAGLKDEIDAKKLEIAKKIKVITPANPKALLEAKAEIERLKSLQSIFQSKNEALSAENREYVAKVLELQTAAEDAQIAARTIEEQKKILDEKLKTAALSVADLKVVGVQKKGSSEVETFKAFKTDKLKITFTILANDLVDPGNKDIVIRLIGTNNEVLTNDNEKLTDTDQLSTMVQTIDYQGDPIKTTIIYTQAANYKKGTYSIELINNDKLMGRASFILR